jgi:hypothetical protein
MDTPERTIKDLQNISNGMIGKVFYHKCEDDTRYYRTIRLHFNPFSNSLQKQVSNPVYGEPPDGIPPLPPSLFGRLNAMCLSNSYESFY